MAPGNRKNPRNALSSASQYQLSDFLADFPNDEACLTWLWDKRFNLGNDEAHCARCGEIRQFRRYETKQQRQNWDCTVCGLHVHPTAGTIFHKSSTSLQLWFYATYLMTSTRSGISAKQLERELGVTYKTAWRMFNLIRTELMIQDEDMTLDGEVEADEMYVGGRPHQSEQHKWGPPNSKERRQGAMRWSMDHRTGVFGMVERQGRVSAFVIPQQPGQVIMGHIQSKIAPTAHLFTDESALYRNVMTHTGVAAHSTINHSAKVYVSGNVHTQTIESFWSQVKRGIVGVHGHVSPKHLQGYLNEYVWRFNHRKDGRIMFFTLALRSAFPVAG